MRFIEVFLISSISVLVMVILFSSIYFLNQLSALKRQEKAKQALLSSLKSSQKVVLESGILGEIVAVNNNTISLQIAPHTVIEVVSTSINRIHHD